jgi:hypothetical protein
LGVACILAGIMGEGDNKASIVREVIKALGNISGP